MASLLLREPTHGERRLTVIVSAAVLMARQAGRLDDRVSAAISG
jgi:hypothetical protein